MCRRRRREFARMPKPLRLGAAPGSLREALRAGSLREALLTVFA
jgi:hypothetical protein